MTDLVRINSDNGVGLPITLADGSRYIVPAFVLVNLAGTPVAAQGGTELDTNGNVVPTWKAQSFTYDENGNLSSTKVIDGQSSWVRTYGVYAPGGPSTDSGWVKQ